MYTLYLNIWSHIHALLVLSAYKTYKTGCGWNLWMENTRGCDGADHQVESVCPSLLITADDQRDVSITTKGIRQCRARPTRWRENLEKQKWTKWNPELLILMPFRAPPTSRFSGRCARREPTQTEGRCSPERTVRRSRVPGEGMLRLWWKTRGDVDNVCDAISYLLQWVRP